ncbi:MAG: thermonuclease family protein [Planctomycetota bacterium]
MSRQDKGRSKKGGTGKHARPGKAAPPPASGPNPLVLGGVVVVVMVLLGLALSVAMRDKGAPAPSPSVAAASPSAEPSASPSASAKPKPSEAPKASPSAEPSAEPSPAPSESEPEPSESPEPEPSKYVANPSGPVPPAPEGEMARSEIKGPTEVVELKRVLDGDTFDTTDGRRIRMVGINTPELHRPFHDEAGALLLSLIKGKKITLEYDKDRKGRFGRTLAYVHADGVFVSGEIVRRGYAYVYLYPNTKLHNEQLVALQREARAAKRILWSKPLPEPAPLYIGNKNAPYFHREGCKRISKLRKSNRVEFKARDDALDAGMNPCEDCKS